jgi:hypothetical protein
MVFASTTSGRSGVAGQVPFNYAEIVDITDSHGFGTETRAAVAKSGLS